MRQLTSDLINRVHMARAGIKPLKWHEIYDSEQDLINDMLTVNVNVNEVPYHKLIRGYAYIEGFQKYYTKHGVLTDKQLTQLKRLAIEIAYNIISNK